jgi:hypothetical protein
MATRKKPDDRPQSSLYANRRIDVIEIADVDRLADAIDTLLHILPSPHKEQVADALSDAATACGDDSAESLETRNVKLWLARAAYITAKGGSNG